MAAYCMKYQCRGYLAKLNIGFRERLNCGRMLGLRRRMRSEESSREMKNEKRIRGRGRGKRETGQMGMNK